MEIKVDQVIKELLFDHPVVIVPGLGGFTRERDLAVLDYVQGMIFPPGCKLEFKPHLVTNDGLLTHKIQETYTVSVSEATAAIQEFVKHIRQLLSNREIVEIAGVGRIYQDYEQQLRFLPEGENFNPDAYGLPAVPFAPLVRERVTARSGSGAAPPEEKEPGRPIRRLPVRMQQVLPWLVVLSALALAVLVYRFVLRQGSGGAPMADTVPIPASRQESLQTEAEAGVSQEESPLPEDIEVTSTAEAVASFEGETSVFLVVHSFGVRSNATRLAAELASAGFAAETQKVDRLYRVGILFRYQDDKELENMRKELGKRFKSVPKTARELDEQMGR
jgi:hypothetical protein